MSDQGALRRSLLLVSAGVAVAGLFYLAYFSHDQKPVASAGLQRSNAIRRPRRRWRHGHIPLDLPDNPMAQAIRRLNGRIASRQPYGRYDNRVLFDINQDVLDEGHFDLLPQNLAPMCRELIGMRDLTDFEKDILNMHIESMFLQNFLQEEFPPGYIIGDDVESLVDALRNHGISDVVVRIMVERFDSGRRPTPMGWDLHEEVIVVDQVPQSDGMAENVTPQDAIATLRGASQDEMDAVAYDDDDESDPGGSQDMLDLLYHIAGEQAKRDSLIHRGVECNSCGDVPIRGVRYHCANCFDYDLCETCEAQQVHHKSHVFYKIRVPAPSRGHIKQVAPVWYPGNPNAFPSSLPKQTSKIFTEENRIEKTELESYYEHFKCLAGHSISRESDPARLGMAIDRKGFDLYFTTTSSDRPPPSNLMYDRIFAYYDYNSDDLITFDEFVKGMIGLQDKTRAARVSRMFKGYDLDGDGYVDRRDFLRMLRAYYAWHKELKKEIIMNQDELQEDVHDAVRNSHPISQAFDFHDFAGHRSRGGEDKEPGPYGDMVIVEGPNGVLANESDMRGDRARAVGNAAVRGQTRNRTNRSFRPEPPADDPVMSYSPASSWDSRDMMQAGDASAEDLNSPDVPLHVYGWPPGIEPSRDDVFRALGADLPLDDVVDPTDRARVIYEQAERIDQEFEDRLNSARQEAIHQRWRRRQFYLDEEEGMTKPPGYTEPDSSDEEDNESLEETNKESMPATNLSSRRQSMRSRSSSKVRFDDSAIDTDYETRSNTSSRSIPVNERWGGFELSEPEKDIGREILYQAVQQGFNELLDPLFKQKEEEALEAIGSRSRRTKWKVELDAYEDSLRIKAEEKEAALRDADMLRTEELLANGYVDEVVRTAQILNGGKPEPDVATTIAENPYDSDNINAMFDDLLQTQSSPPQTTINEGSYSDPTLPHNRPNDTFTSALLLGISHAANSSTKFEASLKPEIPPSQPTLDIWLKHRAIDAEATLRGGYAKLSFREFKQRLVQESIAEVDGPIIHMTRPTTGLTANNAQQQRGLEDGNNTTGIERIDLNTNIGEEDVDGEERTWSSTADLGRLSFLGSWLEMAQF